MAIPSNLPQTDYIQGLWHLDETSGTRYDETTNDNDLSDINTVGYASGKIGNAADFELSNSEYLSITDGDQTGLGITGEITICAWIKPESININQEIVSKITSDNYNQRCYDLLVAFTNEIYFRLSADGINETIAISTDTLSAGSFYHICATLNQTTDKMQIYINGSANGNAVSYTSDIFDGSKRFMIGTYDRQEGLTYFFDGLIDEVIVWNKALTAEEVSQVYNISAYHYGEGILNWWFMKDAWEKHDKLWRPKLAIPKLEYQI